MLNPLPSDGIIITLYDHRHGCAIVKLKTYRSGETKFSLEMSYPEDEVSYEGFVMFLII